METQNQYFDICCEAEVSENSSLAFEAIGVEILEAASGSKGDNNNKPKIPTFSMVAYTGGAMQVGFYYPVVVDLSGVRLEGKALPILHGHDSHRVVGHAESTDISASQIKVKGVISGAGPDALEIVQSAKQGFPWRASIGARITSLEEVKEGETQRVNGKNFKGPIYIARKSILKEVSFVAVPADSKTSSKVAAVAAGNKDNKECNSMNFDNWLKAKGFDNKDDLSEKQLQNLQAMYDAEIKVNENRDSNSDSGTDGGVRVVTATDPATQQTVTATGTTTVTSDDNLQATRDKTADELMRQDKILKLCGSTHIEIAAKAIKENWSFEKVELEVLRASRPSAGPYIITGDGGGGSNHSVPSSQVLEAAVCMSTNLPDMDKSFNEQILEAADKQYKGQIGLQQLLVEAAYTNGYTGGFAFRSNMRDIVQAAFSTMSLPGIFSNIANKFLLAGFNAVEDTWKQITSIRSVADFKTVTSYRLTGNFMYEEVAPDGELQHAKVGEESFTNRAKTYGKMFSVTRTDLINDDLGALTTTPKMIGRGGALKRNDVFWTKFMNNSSFFTTDRKNYKAGTTTALSIDSLTTAEQMYFDQVDSDGHPLGINPALLLVPNALITLATQLMSSLQIREDGGSSKSKYATDNPHAGKFKPVRSSYLSNSKYTGNSSKAWYLLANPNDMPVIEMVVLNGSMVPKVESASADFNTLGIQFRGYDDFGFELQEYQGGVKLKGEA